MKNKDYSLRDFAALAKIDFSNKELIELKKAEAIHSFDCIFENAPSFFFIIDYTVMKYLYLSKSVKNVLGISQNIFLEKGIDYTFSCIHNEDLPRLKLMHQKLFEYYYSVPVSQRKDLKFATNYRFRKSNGSYIMLLQESVLTKISAEGHPLSDFSTCSDITGYKVEKTSKLIIYKRVDNCYEQVYEYKVNEANELLTERQIEILNLLSKGYKTWQIAELLFLSEETVKIHRRNILQRTGARNSIEAVNMLMKTI